MKSFQNEELIKKTNRQKALVFIAHGWNKKVKLKTVQFTGIKTIQWIHVKETIQFGWEFTCLQGKASFYLVHKKQVYPFISEEGKKETTLSLPYGWYRLRVVGECASLQLELHYITKTLN